MKKMSKITQLSMFDGAQQFKIDKPIRLIELFSGYGSQSLALKYLGVPFESYKIAEWAVKSIQAYKDMHFTDDNTNYSESLTKDEIINYLYEKGISADYNQPMTLQQIQRLGEYKARQIYNNIQSTHNLVSVCNIHGKDLEITDTDKYCYIMTYSFPCQDLSNAGLGKGMGRDSGTRSGLLWEVERILKELRKDNKPLPQVLLMENVPEVIGKKNIKHFEEWLKSLDELGYKSKYEVLNAKDFGIPQNRNRCFMISILGDYYYEFPQKQPLKLRLKDMLEDNADEKYYLSDIAVKGAMNTSYNCTRLESRTEKNGVMPTLCARDYKGPKLVVENSIKSEQVGVLSGGKWDKMYDIARRVYSSNGLSPTITTCGGGQREPKIMEEPIKTLEPNLKQKLCNNLIASGKVREMDVIRHSYTKSRMNGEMKDIKANNMCPTLDTRADCLGVCTDYRIRKFTPKEAFRLMGVKDEDYENVAVNQSNSSLYHLAGDSIVVDVLCVIFNQML